MKLMKELPRVAARVLKNTRCVHPDMKARLELLEEAYGTAAVVRDFTTWCEENRSESIPYPITQYLKVVDSRLGLAPAEATVDLKNPGVSEIVSMTYELTTILPSATSVAKLLALYPLDEVRDALREFVETLEEKNLRGGMHLFYREGGADAIILARRRRNQTK